MRSQHPSSATLIRVVWAGLAIGCGGDDPIGPNPPVATVTVAPADVTLPPGARILLTAAVTDVSGAALAGRTITWSSSNTLVATVSDSGLVTANAQGSVTITASSEGKSGSAAIAVQTEGLEAFCPSGGMPSDRCARVVGTIRDVEGTPVAGASVAAISASPSEVGFETDRVAETDVAGRFELEVRMIVFSDDPGTPVDTVGAYLRASLDLPGEAAVDTSVLTQMVFVLHGTRPPVDTIDLVIDRNNTLPRPGGRLAFVHDPVLGDDDFGDLYVINADGSGRRPLLVAPTTAVDPAWTPDGQAVLFIFAEIGTAGRLSLIDADGGNLRPFGTDLFGIEPRWAPDGQHVAFLAGYTDDAEVPHEAGVWIANPDGTEPYRLPTQDDQRCVAFRCTYVKDPFGWYPDADGIGYTVWTRSTSDPERLYTTRLSDSTTAPIVGPFPLSVSPDGSRLLVPDFNLLEIRAANGTPLAKIPVASGTIDVPRAVWSPDGEWIAYVFRGASGRLELWIADRDGNRRRRIALDAEDPDWQRTPATLR